MKSSRQSRRKRKACLKVGTGPSSFAALFKAVAYLLNYLLSPSCSSELAVQRTGRCEADVRDCGTPYSHFWLMELQHLRRNTYERELYIRGYTTESK